VPDADRRLVQAAIEEYTIECSILKVFGTETCDFVADEALQILGGYGFIADYAIERHYRDNRVYRIFEGTNEINRLIIPATLLKRIGRGALAYTDFLGQVEREIADRAAWPPAIPGPLEREHRAAEVAKRVVAYVTRLLVEKDLASLKEKQQHLEVLANMIIDVFAMDSVVNRTRLLLGHGSADDDALRVAMTKVFVASANERVIDGARRLLVNEFEGEELAKHLRLESIIPRLPIRTIAVKTRIAEALAARGLGPVFLR
jgi:alkylation response protein AidB-like acyl-CoA dehydrogenase